MVKSDKIKTRVLVSLLMASVFSLAGCGGSSGGGGGTAASPDGVYTGSITGGQGVNGFNGGEKAAIYNGKMLLLSTPGNIQQIFEIPFTISGTNVSGSISIYNNSVPVFATTTATGSFVENQTVNLSFTDLLLPNGNVASQTTPGTISLIAKTTGYNQGSDLSLLGSGNVNWSGTHGPFSDATNISFSSSGDISGGTTNEGCPFTGTTTIPDISKNLYLISITTTDAINCTSLPPSTYNGYAWFDEGDNNTLNFIVTNGSYARAIVLTRN